jgi:hypothetical protein
MTVGSSIICLIERAHRPHGTIRPKYRKNSPVVRGGTLIAIAVRTTRSLSTLQEQMITMVVSRLSVLGRLGACARGVKRTRRRARRITAQGGSFHTRSHPRNLHGGADHVSQPSETRARQWRARPGIVLPLRHPSRGRWLTLRRVSYNGRCRSSGIALFHRVVLLDRIAQRQRKRGMSMGAFAVEVRWAGGSGGGQRPHFAQLLQVIFI